MDEYDLVKKSSLKFKGEKKLKKANKAKKRKLEGQEGDSANATDQSDLKERQEDAAEHGDWWKVSKYEEIKDDVAIEFIPGCYAKSLSNGRIVLGQLHPPGEGPDEEEIFTAIGGRVNQVSFKSGFDRYLAVDSKKRLMGLSEAIGELESFLPVFEENKTALCASNDCFLSVNEDSNIQQIVARSTKAGPNEMVTIRVRDDPQRRKKSSGLT